MYTPIDNVFKYSNLKYDDFEIEKYTFCRGTHVCYTNSINKVNN